MSLCLVRLIEPVFWSIKHCESSFFFFRKQCFDWFKLLFQNFFNLFSLSPTWQGSTKGFLSFFSQIFARFFSHKAGKTFIPLLLFLFSCFHALFQTFSILGFVLIQCYFSKIDHWVFLLYWYVHDICWLIWSIWGFMNNWKF